jgi:hypothetical protein
MSGTTMSLRSHQHGSPVIGARKPPLNDEALSLEEVLQNLADLYCTIVYIKKAMPDGLAH